MRVWLAVPLLIVGCLGGPASGDPRFEALVAGTDVEVEVTPTTGAIRGIVVDAAIRPIAGARIRVEDKVTTSNEGGGFGFSDLPPGDYFLQVTHPGYHPVGQVVPVQAGAEPPWSRIILESLPSDLPRYDVHHLRGMIGASVLVAVAGIPAGFVAWDPVSSSYFSHRFEVPSEFELVQAAVVWGANNPLFRDLSLGVAAQAWNRSAGHGVDWVTGPSPLVAPLESSDFAAAGDGFYAPLNVEVFVWAALDWDAPASIGAAVRQGFDAYTHVFYNFAPPSNWTFARDGPPP